MQTLVIDVYVSNLKSFLCGVFAWLFSNAHKQDRQLFLGQLAIRKKTHKRESGRSVMMLRGEFILWYVERKGR